MGYSTDQFLKDMEAFNQTGKFPTTRPADRPWYEELALAPARALSQIRLTGEKFESRLFNKPVEEIRQKSGSKITAPIETGAKWSNITGDILGEVIPAVALEAVTFTAAPALEGLIFAKLPSVASWVSRSPTAYKTLKTAAIGAGTGAITEGSYEYARGGTPLQISQKAGMGAALGGSANVLGDFLLPKIASRFLPSAASISQPDNIITAFSRTVRESDYMAFTGRNAAEAIEDMSNPLSGLVREGMDVNVVREGIERAANTASIARRAVAEAPQEALDALKQTSIIYDEVELHTASELVRKFKAEGDIKKVYDVMSTVSGKSADMPLLQLRNANIYSLLDEADIKPFTEQVIKNIGGNPTKHMSDKLITEVTDRLKEIKKMPMGEKRSVASMGMVSKMVDEVPKEFLEQLGAARKIAMLSSPITHVKNIFSNLANLGINNMASIPAVGLDIITGLFTGQRTKTLSNMLAQYAGAKTGSKISFDAVFNGVQLGRSAKELSNNPVFKNQIMGSAQKALGVVMEVPDQAFYWAKFNDEILAQMRLKGLDANTVKPTLEMLQSAHYAGSEIVYKQEGTIVKLLENIRTQLNKFSTLGLSKQFGLGDFILPFIRTPVNIAKTMMDYSPVGVMNGIYKLGKMVVGRNVTPALQREFVEAMSKGGVGTAGLMGIGYFGASMGFISGGGEYDTTIDPILNQQGMGKNRINISAMLRGITSGFQDLSLMTPQKEDKIMTYNWFQPVSAMVSLGAGVGQRRQQQIEAGEDVNAISAILSAASGMLGDFEDDTIFGSFINTLSKNYYEDEGWFMGRLQTMASEIPASFIPNFLTQARKAFDNTSRRTFDEEWSTRMVNLMKNKIPMLSKSLEASYTNFGAVREIYPESTNIILDALLNPATINSYDLEPAQEYLIGLYELLPPVEWASAEEKEKTDAIAAMYKAMGKKPPAKPDQPRYDVLPNKWTKIRHPDGKSEPYEMTNTDRIIYQTEVNDFVIANINNLFIDPKFKNGNPDVQLGLVKKAVKSAATSVEQQMQIEMFGYAYSPNKSKTSKYRSVTKQISARNPKINVPKTLNLPTQKAAARPIKGL